MFINNDLRRVEAAAFTAMLQRRHKQARARDFDRFLEPSRIGSNRLVGMDRQGDARMAYNAHGFFFNVVVVADGWIISPVSPLRPTFPFSACCPGTDHLAIHLGPVLLITRLGLRMRTTVPPCRSETSCALKRGTSTLGLFSSVFLSLSLSPLSFAIDGEPPRLSFFLPCPPLSALCLRLFYTACH